MGRRGRWWALSLVVASGCHRYEERPWPEVPPGTQALLLISVVEGSAKVEARDGAELGPYTAPEASLYLRFLAQPLAALALEAGRQPLGNDRPLPEGLASFAGIDGVWQSLSPSAAEAALSSVRLAEPRRDLCLAGGGCYGLSPQPSACQAPCPCAKAALRAEPYPHNECPLPGPVRARLCFQRQGLLRGLAMAGASDRLGSLVLEGGRTVLYFSTDRFGPGGAPALARVELEPSFEVRPERIERLTVGLPPGRTAERPHLRADGLELWFESASATTAISQVWVADRARSDLSFGRARPVEVVYDAHGSHHPTLLGDFRTLIYRSESLGVLAIARTTTTAGEIEHFNEFPPFALAPMVGAYALSLGCDRQSLYYLRSFPAPTTLAVASFERWSPLSLDRTIVVEDPAGAALSWPPAADGVVESPDCQQLLVLEAEGTVGYQAVPCPN